MKVSSLKATPHHKPNKIKSSNITRFSNPSLHDLQAKKIDTIWFYKKSGIIENRKKQTIYFILSNPYIKSNLNLIIFTKIHKIEKMLVSTLKPTINHHHKQNKIKISNIWVRLLLVYFAFISTFKLIISEASKKILKIHFKNRLKILKKKIKALFSMFPYIHYL